MKTKLLVASSVVAAGIFLAACQQTIPGQLRTVRFQVSADTLAEGSTVHISGNHEDLGQWDPPGVQFTREASGIWSRSFEFPEGAALEYKFTLGSWETEAVDESGLEYPNFRLEVRSDTTVQIRVHTWRSFSAGQGLLSPVRFKNKAGRIELLGPWKFHAGDDPRWAFPSFDDTRWETLSPQFMIDWPVGQEAEAIGWFRLRMTVDSALLGAPVGLQVTQMGASDVFLNGRRLFSMGVVEADPSAVRPLRDVSPKVVTLAPGTEQLLAVRYASPLADKLHAAGMNAGFSIVVHDDPNEAIRAYQAASRASTIQQSVFSVIPLVLAFTHLLLFAFYPSNRANLFYALSMVGWAGISYTSFQGSFITEPAEALLLLKLSWASISTALAFGVLTAYARSCDAIPLVPKALAGAAFVLVPIGILAYASWIPIAYYVLIALTAFEMVRAMLVGRMRERGSGWIVGVGSILLMAAVILQVLIGLDVLTEFFGTRLVYIYGVLALSFSVSIDLSQSVARSNRDLKRQIAQIKELSALNLEQERRAKEEEVNRRILEADNRRKTQELEQARALQLSMLPQRLPELDGLDIAAYMQPATEVGGDYYDFHVGESGELTLVVGDATGHGTRAGTMVTVAKSLFRQLATENDVLTMLRRYNDSIRSLNLGSLYMALAIARFTGRELHVAAAGMPPLLLYRHARQSVEVVPLKGMPLGSTLDFPYQQQMIPLHERDLALFMSDGFPELMNDAGQQLGYERGATLLQGLSAGSPQEVLDAFVAEAKSWAGDRPYNDDVTFVALKVRETARPGSYRSQP